MRVVLDSNVIVAAFAARGLCAEVFELALYSHTLIVSDHIIEEVRKAFEEKIRLPRKIAKKNMGLISAHALFVTPAPVSRGACRDASDLPVLGTAIAGRAEAVVTGDPDLLLLKKYKEIPILSPRSFWDAIHEP